MSTLKTKTPPSLQVYFILAVKCNLIKIGSTADLSRRLYEMSTASPDELRILGVMPGGYTTERTLHRAFKTFRRKGEWFAADQFILDFIREHCSKSDAVVAYANEESDRRRFRREAAYQRKINTDKLRGMQTRLDELNKSWRVACAYDSSILDFRINPEDRRRIMEEVNSRTQPISKEIDSLRDEMKSFAFETGIYTVVKGLKKEILNGISKGYYPGHEDIVRHAVEDGISLSDAAKLYHREAA